MSAGWFALLTFIVNCDVTQASTLSALQTTYSLKRSVPPGGETGPKKCDEEHEIKMQKQLMVRLKYLEGLAAKQHAKLEDMLDELKGENMTQFEQPVKGTPVDARLAMLEGGFSDRSTMTTELLAAVTAATVAGKTELETASQSCSAAITPCTCT